MTTLAVPEFWQEFEAGNEELGWSGLGLLQPLFFYSFKEIALPGLSLSI